MTTPEAVAEKVAQKVAEVLSPMKLEMGMKRWPPEFCVIMWDAIAHHATLLANEQRQKT